MGFLWTLKNKFKNFIKHLFLSKRVLETKNEVLIDDSSETVDRFDVMGDPSEITLNWFQVSNSVKISVLKSPILYFDNGLPIFYYNKIFPIFIMIKCRVRQFSFLLCEENSFEVITKHSSWVMTSEGLNKAIEDSVLTIEEQYKETTVVKVTLIWFFKKRFPDVNAKI